jgi:hypothetical protein
MMACQHAVPKSAFWAQYSFQPQQLRSANKRIAPLQSTSVSAGDSRFLCSVDEAFELG